MFNLTKRSLEVSTKGMVELLLVGVIEWWKMNEDQVHGGGE